VAPVPEIQVMGFPACIVAVGPLAAGRYRFLVEYGAGRLRIGHFRLHGAAYRLWTNLPTESRHPQKLVRLPGSLPMTKRQSKPTRTPARKKSASRTQAPNPARRIGRFLVHCLLAGCALGLALSVLVVLPWRWLAPPTTAFILRDQLASAQAVHYRWVSWDNLSPYLPIAVVAAEDQKFPHHRGFDFDQILKATRERRGRKRGASTISQQVAKNLFLWSGRSYVRKGLEAWLTVLVETLWPKRRILEIYVNVAEFGPGIYGAGAASDQFFHKDPSRLGLREATLLAAVLPSPRRMSAARPSAYVKRRAREIAGWIRKLGGPKYLADL
jgi:monofunctional biosynthetic peptidoglycan transglycosylase